MLDMILLFENKKLKFNLNGVHRTIRVKDIHLAIDEINLFKEGNKLNDYELLKLDNFVESAQLAASKLNDMRSIAEQYIELSSDKFVEFVANLPKSDDAEKEWKTYILTDVDSEFVKIGRTGNIKRRISELKNNSGRDLRLFCSFDFDVESKLHSIFAEFRKNGEWFLIPRSILIEKVESLKMQIQPDIFID